MRMSKDSPNRFPEDVAQRKARLAREAALLEEGRADLRAGRSLSGEALDAWLEDLDREEELPVTTESPVRSRR